MGQAGRAPRLARQPDRPDEAVEGGPAGRAGHPRRLTVAAFRFVQFEYGFALGPEDGRYLRRTVAGGAPERVIVLKTLAAVERRRLRRGRSPRPERIEAAEEAAPVPTGRATIVSAQPFASHEEAQDWLERVHADQDAREGELAEALRELNAVLRAHRAAAADPYARDVSLRGAHAVRIGFGSGEQVADGHFTAAYEVPLTEERVKRSVALQPQERLAALLGASARVLVGEELLLRARADLDAGRMREAALQARIALEALVAEVATEARPRLEAQREPVAAAANAALDGELEAAHVAALADAVDVMRRELLRAAR